VKKTQASSEEILQEDQLIRGLLNDHRRIMGSFPAPLEQVFWQAVAERSIQMIRNVTTTGLLVYVLLGLITFPTVYFLSSEPHRLHDILIWLLAYLNGAVCLAVLPIMASIPSLTIHFQKFIIAITFFGVFFTSFLTADIVQPIQDDKFLQ
jgi:hypothetical protein